jgi:AcrR family transcriptional regulator
MDLQIFGEAEMGESERRAEILRAARHLALRNGLQGVTMEAIAKEARVAKPTLYKYYGDKSAVFSAIVTELLVELHGRFSAELNDAGDVAERIAAALAAKYAAITDFMAGSPHADEMYNETDRLTAPQVEVAEKASDEAVITVLTAAGVAEPEAVARVVIGGAYGIFRKARPGEDIGPAIRMLVTRVVGK